MPSWSPKNRGDKFSSWFFSLGIFFDRLSRYAAIPLIVALSLVYSEITRFLPWSPIATGNNLHRDEKIPNLSQMTGNFDVFVPHSGILRPTSRRSSACPNVHDDGVASGDFNFDKQPFILSYDVRCKVCVVAFVTRYRKLHTHPLHIRS